MKMFKCILALTAIIATCMIMRVMVPYAVDTCFDLVFTQPIEATVIDVNTVTRGSYMRTYTEKALTVEYELNGKIDQMIGTVDYTEVINKGDIVRVWYSPILGMIYFKSTDYEWEVE